MADVLNVTKRDLGGKRRCRRMRQSGQLPAVLYGHGEESVSLTVKHEEFARAQRHGGRVFELRGAVTQGAVVRDLQWDTFGHDVLHIDFMRVRLDERVEVEVPIETRGEAPGVNAGGVVNVLLHEVPIEVMAAQIPEKLVLNINELEVGASLTGADIEGLPPDAKLLIDPKTPLVTCEMAAEEVDDDGLEAGSVEPEVIGRTAEAEGDEP